MLWMRRTEKVFKVRGQTTRSRCLHLWELCECDISLVTRGISVFKVGGDDVKVRVIGIDVLHLSFRSFSTPVSISVCVEMRECYMSAEAYIATVCGDARHGLGGLGPQNVA